MPPYHAAARKLSLSARNSIFAKPAVFAGCLAGGVIAVPSIAAAHVKWFVNCNVSDDPLPLHAVFSDTFFMFLMLFLAVFSVACLAERTIIGALLSEVLDRCTQPLRGRANELLRAVAAIFFALLWAQGGAILTPELTAAGTSLSTIQLLIPVFLFNRATLPAAGVGIIVLYGYGVAAYGLFHMMDYPVFLGIGIFFILSVSPNPKVVAVRFHLLRWSVAFSLLWPAMEKFLYPSWVAAIAIVHPELTLGFPVDTAVTAAGIVEFGLSFALFWTPLVRRLAALALMLLLTSATLDFGKPDAIGHSAIIAILLVVFADPDGKPQRCHPMFAPLASSAALLATIFFYAGGHALYYGGSPALMPLMSGVALLAFIALCAQGSSREWLQMMETMRRWLIIDEAANTRHRSALNSNGARGTEPVASLRS